MVIAPSAPLTDQDHPDVVAARRDRALVKAHRHGDTEAFAGIVQAYHDMLLGQARRQLGDPYDAEDALQETLLRAYRGLDRFGVGGDWRLGAWLTRIMANVCADQRARRAASAALADRLGPGSSSGGDVGDLASDPVALAAVRQALGRLPASQRQAFVLRAVDDLSFADIADQLGISEDNARARVQRARTALRHALDHSVATALGVVPVALGTAWRATVHAVLRPAAHRAAAKSGAAAGPGLSSGLGSGAAGPLSSGAGQAAAGASGVVAGAPTVVSSGAQLVNQVAGQVIASPAGQLLLTTASASSGSGGGRSALVLGLAASVATAGALSLPPTAAPAARRPAPRAQVVAPVASTAGPAAGSAVTSTASSATTGASQSSSEGSLPVSTAAPTGPSGSGGGSATGNTPAPATPSWVLAATSLAAGASATSAGGNVGTSGAGTSAGSSPGTTASGSTSSSAVASVLPAGSCASVAGFPGITSTSDPAATGSASVVRMLDTGAVNLTRIGPDPSFGTTADLTANGVDETSPLQVAVGACLATTGSMLAVDLTGSAGTEVQLVGSLLSASPTNPSTPSAGSTYLFSGTVNPYAGISVDGSLPWGLPDQFVAELQVLEPANTAELTVAFMLPAGATLAPSTTAIAAGNAAAGTGTQSSSSDAGASSASDTGSASIASGSSSSSPAGTSTSASSTGTGTGSQDSTSSAPTSSSDPTGTTSAGSSESASGT